MNGEKKKGEARVLLSTVLPWCLNSSAGQHRFVWAVGVCICVKTTMSLAAHFFLRIVVFFCGRFFVYFLSILLKTSKEMRMLSSVTIICQVTKIVMNPGSQLSEL